MNHQYRGTILKKPTPQELRRAVADYEVMLVTVLDAILERFERDPDYPFINTKLSMLTGEDFPEPADPAKDYKGKTAIFGWIQGRGLESLAGHVRWLPRCSVLSDAEKTDRVRRLREMLSRVLDNLEAIRARNKGGVSFLMTSEGVPFDFDENGRRRPLNLAGGPVGFTNLFYAKGLLAASALLGRKDKVEEAKAYFRKVAADINRDAQLGDRVSFDPKNPATTTSGKISHGPRMIAVGGYALFAEQLGGEEWFEGGAKFIRHILDRHVNLGLFKDLEPHDFVECLDASGDPWIEEGRILSDPGHSLEFVGLSAKLLLLMRRKPTRTADQEQLLARCADLFPKMLLRNFRNGFNPKVGGICKAFDLVSRKPINSDMPWWNLPETMRAGAETLALAPSAPERGELLAMIADCSNGFFKSFVNPKVHLMAYQTVDAHGKPVDVIPATPDADPGYHTGLSIIDFLDCVRAIS